MCAFFGMVLRLQCFNLTFVCWIFALFYVIKIDVPLTNVKEKRLIPEKRKPAVPAKTARVMKMSIKGRSIVPGFLGDNFFAAMFPGDL